MVGRQQDSIPPRVFSVTFESIGIGPRLQTLITIRDCLYKAKACKLRGSGKTPSFNAMNSKILQGLEPTFNLQLPFLIPPPHPTLSGHLSMARCFHLGSLSMGRSPPLEKPLRGQVSPPGKRQHGQVSLPGQPQYMGRTTTWVAFNMGVSLGKSSM